MVTRKDLEVITEKNKAERHAITNPQLAIMLTAPGVATGMIVASMKFL